MSAPAPLAIDPHSLDQAIARELALRDVRELGKYWKFRDRERGGIKTFEHVWPGQSVLADAMEKYPKLFALKAGKLGFTEWECVWDAKVALSTPYGRVHLFSLNGDSAKSLLNYIRFGLINLPDFLRVHIQTKVAGGNTAQQIIFKPSWVDDPDDFRTIVSYPSTSTVSIDQSAQHIHLDEFSHLDDAEGLWGAIETTLAPGGSLHIVTRGAGEEKYSAQIWNAAVNGTISMHPLFQDWRQRPREPDHETFYREQQAVLPPLALSYYCPDTPDDALRGDATSAYIPIERWDTLAEQFAPLGAGDQTPVVVACDAGVTGDYFAIQLASRHPERHDWLALRQSHVWKPEEFPDHRIDFSVPKRILRWMGLGGCQARHPRTHPDPACEFCQRNEWLPPMNVVQITYDPHQLEDFMQELRAEGVAWCDEFPQGEERLIADASLYQRAMQGTLRHDGNPELREHIGNCKAKLQPDEDSKMRIIKKAQDRKVDLAVAASMAGKRCMDLNI